MGYFLDSFENARLPLAPVMSDHLNLFAQYGVTLAAIGASTSPYGSFKIFAAEGIVQRAHLEGILSDPDREFVEATSGCMGYALVKLLWQKYGIHPQRISLIMKSDVPKPKQYRPVVAGAKVITTSGDTIALARSMGGGGWNIEKGFWNTSSLVINFDQYSCPDVKNYYRDRAVPEILDALTHKDYPLRDAGEPDYLFVPLGTGGTAIGLKEGLVARCGKDTKVIVVACAEGEEIPGMRTRKDSAPPKVYQPWEKVTDGYIDVDREPSFLCAPQIEEETEFPTGPSGSATYVGSMLYFQNLIEQGREDEVRGKNVQFVIHDTPDPYMERYENFPVEDLRSDTRRSPRELIFGKQAT
jgi:cysteine synthase